MISIYVTFRDEQEARKISMHLLEKRLIACANFFPVKSLFRWNGKIVDESEYAMLAKAPKNNFEKIRSEIKAMHSYDVPCIVAFQVNGKDDNFSEWVSQETKQ